MQIYVSHGSVATQLKCEGIFNDCVITYSPQYVPVKELWKSVNNWRRYGQKYSGTFLWPTVYIYKCIYKCSVHFSSDGEVQWVSLVDFSWVQCISVTLYMPSCDLTISMLISGKLSFVTCNSGTTFLKLLWKIWSLEDFFPKKACRFSELIWKMSENLEDLR